MDTDERYSIASIRRKLSDGHSLPSPSESAWLLEEAERLTRANRALDHEVARLEAVVRQQEAEFSAAESELLDVSEELSKCRQEVAESRQAAGATASGDARPATGPA